MTDQCSPWVPSPEVAAVLPEITEIRHQLHRIPEIAGQELETSALLRRELEKQGLTVPPSRLQTDVTALLRGTAGEGPCVTLRADIDALPIEELTGVPYASTHPGLMHACGHDGHAAMVLGAACVLTRRVGTFAGSVRFLFQPGEECLALAKPLAASGLLSDPPCQFIAALHGMPGLPLGEVRLRDGAMQASSAHFKVTIHGTGGHGSRPHEAHSPISAGSWLIPELEAIPAGVTEPVVLSVGAFHGGSLDNVIPDTAELRGTARSLTAAGDAVLEREFRRLAAEAEARFHVSCEIDYDLRYRPTINTPAAAQLGREAAKAAFGAYAGDLEAPSMGAEDFSWYAGAVPQLLYAKLGTGNTAKLHNARFDFPDAALGYGIEFLVKVALAALQR